MTATLILFLLHGIQRYTALPQIPVAPYPLQAGMMPQQYQQYQQPQSQSQNFPMPYYQPQAAITASGNPYVPPIALNQAPAPAPASGPASYPTQPQWQAPPFGQQTPQQYPTFYPQGQPFGQLSSLQFGQGQSQMYPQGMPQAGMPSGGMNPLSQPQLPTFGQWPGPQSNVLSTQGMQAYPNQGLQSQQGQPIQSSSAPNAQGASQIQGNAGQVLQSSQQSPVNRGNPWSPVLPQQLVNGVQPLVQPPVQPAVSAAGQSGLFNANRPPPPPWLQSPAAPPPTPQAPSPNTGTSLLQQTALPKGITQIPTIESRAQTIEAMLDDGRQVQSFSDGLTAQFRSKNGCLDPTKSGSLSLIVYRITRKELSMWMLTKDQLSTNIHCQHGQVASNPQYLVLPNNVKPNIDDGVTLILIMSGVGECPKSLFQSSNKAIAFEPFLIGPWGQSSLGIMNLPQPCNQFTNLVPIDLTEAIQKQSDEKDHIQQVVKAENLPTQSGAPQPKT